MAGDHSASAHARCSGTRVVRWVTNNRSYCRWCIRRQGCLLRRCGRPIHFARHVSDEIEVTILLPHLTPTHSNKKLNDGRKCGCALQHAGSEHVGKVDVDVDAGAQDIMFGCESEETELCHLSHVNSTPTNTARTELLSMITFQHAWLKSCKAQDCTFVCP